MYYILIRMERFLYMLRLGLEPMTVLQNMCLKKNMDISTLRQFVQHCTSHGIAIQRESAEHMIEEFTKHKQKSIIKQKSVYCKMHNAGVLEEAIQQKAELEGIVWNPMPCDT